MFIQKHKFLTQPIKRFTIFAERHSGTNYLEYIVSRNLSIDITWNFGWKHWFADKDWSVLNNDRNTLFIGIVRNIYDWIGGMANSPHHLIKISRRNYNSLLSEPFVSYDKSKNIIHADLNFITSKVYSNIFECRYYKNNFLFYYMPFLVDNYILVRYEDLILHHENMIAEIVKFYNLPRRRKYYVPLNELNVSKHKKPYVFPKNIIERINKNTIWDAEIIYDYSMINP